MEIKRNAWNFSQMPLIPPKIIVPALKAVGISSTQAQAGT
jgi:hypothetical protein